ncbi:hypothetical protein [Gordonia malaquae]|uniref:hypothetical protein n=1 Tax=Gordonia malaquae TaxID=410332 RepID=UPI0030FE08D5
MTDPMKLRRLAVLNVLKERIGREIDATKQELGSAIGRGSMTAFATPGDPNSEVLGVLSMSKPRQGAPRIVDEQDAVVWVLNAYADDPSLVEVRLTEQGRKTVIAAAKTGRDIPGAEIPPPGKPTVSFRQTAEAEAEIVAMWERGDLSIADVLEIEAQ